MTPIEFIAKAMLYSYRTKACSSGVFRDFGTELFLIPRSYKPYSTQCQRRDANAAACTVGRVRIAGFIGSEWSRLHFSPGTLRLGYMCGIKFDQITSESTDEDSARNGIATSTSPRHPLAHCSRCQTVHELPKIERGSATSKMIEGVRPPNATRSSCGRNHVPRTTAMAKLGDQNPYRQFRTLSRELSPHGLGMRSFPHDYMQPAVRRWITRG